MKNSNTHHLQKSYSFRGEKLARPSQYTANASTWESSMDTMTLSHAASSVLPCSTTEQAPIKSGPLRRSNTVPLFSLRPQMETSAASQLRNPANVEKHVSISSTNSISYLDEQASLFDKHECSSSPTDDTSLHSPQPIVITPRSSSLPSSAGGPLKNMSLQVQADVPHSFTLSPLLATAAAAAPYDDPLANATKISIARQISISKQQRHLLVPVVSKRPRQPAKPGLGAAEQVLTSPTS